MLAVFRILEIVPGGRRRPALLGEDFGVVHQAGGDDADRNRTIILEARRVVEIGGQTIDLAAEAELDRLVHRTVVDDGDVDLLVAFLRLQFGQRVGRVAGDVLDLDAVRLLETRDHLVAHRLFERAAVTGDIEGLLLGQTR